MPTPAREKILSDVADELNSTGKFNPIEYALRNYCPILSSMNVALFVSMNDENVVMERDWSLKLIGGR